MSGDLNKYEFLTRKDLNYKLNAVDKAKFDVSPLGKAFSTGLDKTAENYQEEGVIKLLKDIRDNLAGGVIRPNNRRNNNNDDDDDDDDDDDYDLFDTFDTLYTPYYTPYTSYTSDNNDDDHNADMPDLETEGAAERIADSYEQKKESKTRDDRIKILQDKILDLVTKLKDSKLSIEEKDKLYKELRDNNDKFKVKYKESIKNIEKDMDNFYEKSNDSLNTLNDEISILDNKIFKMKKVLIEKKIYN